MAFQGVSICPRDRVSRRIQFPTVLFCESRAAINIDHNGIFRILSKRHQGNSDYMAYAEDLQHDIQYVRVFPSRAQACRTGQGQAIIQLDGRNYAHGAGVDLIVVTQLNTNHYILFTPDEQLDL